MSSLRRSMIGVAACAAIGGGVSAGPEWVEQGDAGRLPGTAQPTEGEGAVTKIRGTLTGTSAATFGPVVPDFHDMYVIFIDNPATFTAHTVVEPAGATEFDSQLYLFQVDGLGLLGNDNTLIITSPPFGEGGAPGSFLTNASTDGTNVVITEPGLYVLAITNAFEFPISGPFGQRIFEFFSSIEVSGPDGPGGADPIDNWENNFLNSVGGFTGEYEIILSGVTLIPPSTIQANLDIKPGGCPNSFNRTSNGVLPVSLLGTADFDVADVDLSTVRIKRADGVGGELAPHEGPPGPHSTYGDEGTPYTGPAGGCHEAQGDGITDLNMKFKSQSLTETLQLAGLPAGSLVELNVVGELNDGTEFTSTDFIRLVPPGTPPGLLAVSASTGGTWVDVWPPDLSLDSGGFPSFQRDFPQTTVVTLSSPQAERGFKFVGWRINGSSDVINTGTIQVSIGAMTQHVEAVFLEETMNGSRGTR